jgi:hypothetical protein
MSSSSLQSFRSVIRIRPITEYVSQHLSSGSSLCGPRTPPQVQSCMPHSVWRTFLVCLADNSPSAGTTTVTLVPWKSFVKVTLLIAILQSCGLVFDSSPTAESRPSRGSAVVVGVFGYLRPRVISASIFSETRTIFSSVGFVGCDLMNAIECLSVSIFASYFVIAILQSCGLVFDSRLRV